MRFKIHYFLIGLFVFMFCPSVFSNTNKDTTIRDYKVEKIFHQSKAFIIYLHNEKEDKWYTLVSIKKKVRGYSKIKVGSTYALRLNPYFNQSYIPDHARTFRVIIEGVKVSVKSESWTGNVYTSENLKGLYYIPYPARSETNP